MRRTVTTMLRQVFFIFDSTIFRRLCLTSICAVLVPSHVPVPVPTGTHVCWGVFLFRKAEELSEKSSF